MWENERFAGGGEDNLCASRAMACCCCNRVKESGGVGSTEEDLESER